MNKVFLVGNLGADAEVHYTQGGKCVIKLRLCTTERWANAQGKQEKATWHTCVYWVKDGSALSKHLTKGKTLSIVGSLDNRSWEKQDGSKGYATEVRVSELEFVGGGKGVGQQQRGRTQDGYSYDQGTGVVSHEDDGADDIPF